MGQCHSHGHSGADQVQQLLKAHHRRDQGHQERIRNGGQHVDGLTWRIALPDFHHDAVPPISAFVEHRHEIRPIDARRMLQDGHFRLSYGHGLGSTTQA